MDHSVLRPAGHIWITDLDGNVSEYDTLQCAHCQGHWKVIPGSGRKRGYCLNCAQVTCGRPCCDVCIPIEQRIENIEAGRPEDFKRILAAVPQDFDLGLDS